MALAATIAAVACARGTRAPPSNPQPRASAAAPVRPAVPVVAIAAPPAEPAVVTRDAAADAPQDACTGADLDLDALNASVHCALPEQPGAAKTDPDVVARIDATELKVAPGATVRVPVVFENPTDRTLSLELRGCADEGALVGGLLGDAGTPARDPIGLSQAFEMRVETATGKRADEAKGDDVGCLAGCAPIGVRVRLLPGAHARATLEYRARVHRWVQCEREDAGPLPPGTYRLVVTGADNHTATAKLVVH